jgi:uncharacterized membrane protein
MRTWNLWAVGYDDPVRAEQVRDEITRLGWERHDLILGDVAVVVRHRDGSFTIDREPFPAVGNVLAATAVGFLAGLAVAAPLTGAAVGALLGGGVSTLCASVGIGNDFVRDVQSLMKPGTSALFVLDAEGDMEVILHALRGLGGTVLKTNVDLERARLIQSTLAAASADTSEPAGG